MIGSLMSRMEDAQKLSIQQLQKSIQDGVLPAYIGIPLLQDKIKQAQSAQSPQAPQQPPIAQQVLEQAKQIESGMIPQQPMPPQPQMAQAPQQPSQMAQQMPQGIDSAESNLPTEMAEGGIVGFANGGVTGGGEMQLTVPISIGGEGGGGPYTGFGGGGFGGGGGGYAPPGGPQGGSVGSLASLGRGAQQMQPPAGAAPQAAQGAQMNMQENAQSAQGASADVNGFTPIQTNQGTLLAGQFLQGLSGIPNQKTDNAMGAKSFGYQQMESAPQPILGMAKGGPVGYAKGILIDDEDDDIDPTEDFRTASRMFARDPMEQRRESASILGMGDSIRPMLSSFTQPISDFASGIKSKFINKTPEVDIVTKPQVQPEGGIPGIIASKAQKYNLPPQLMSSIAKAESNFNPNAGNKTGSSAKGLYQFIDKTWMGMGGKPGEQFDPEMNSELGAKYIRQNAEFLKNRLGRDPSYSEVYAAHYFGPSGASNLLTRASPKDSIEKGLGTFNDPKGVKLIMKQNPNLRGKTVGQVLNDLETKTGSGIVSLAEGGQIKHFQVGNLVTDDYRKNYDRIFKNKAAQANLTNPAGISSLKVPLSLFPVSAAGMQPPMLGANPAPAAPSSIISNFDPKTANNRPGTSYTPVGAKPPVNINKLIKGSSDSNTLMGVDDAKYYLDLQEKANQFPDDPIFKETMDKIVKRNPNVLNDIKSLKPTSSLLGPINEVNKAQLENANRLRDIKENASKPAKPPVVKVDPNYADVTDSEMAGEKYEYVGRGADFGPTREEMEPIPKKAEEKNAFDTFLEGLEAKRAEIKGKKDEDKYMSLLAAGLGMMSGTSQYAGANIGKGALAGVQDYRDTQKQRAAELAAVDKEIGSGLYRKTVGDYYSANALSKDEKAKLGQAALLEKTQQNAQNTIANIEKDLMARALASVKDSLAYTTGSDEKRQSLLNASYSGMRQRMMPYITSLQKKAGLEIPDMDAMLSSDNNKKSTAGWSLVK